MAQNYISRAEVITLTAGAEYKSGEPYRIKGFNGVALITVSPGELLVFQLQAIFEFVLSDVKMGDLILIRLDDDTLHVAQPAWGNSHFALFGRAVTASDENEKFHCRLLQS